MNELNEEDLLLLASIGDIFAGLRKEAGLTQRQAAVLGDSTQARVSYLEGGNRDILISTLRRWAEVYGYSLEIHLTKRDDLTALLEECAVEVLTPGQHRRKES